MISLLRKEDCSGSIYDLAHIPSQSCLADCLTKASAKADNLIRKIALTLTLMEHKAFVSTWCKTFLHTKEMEVFFLNTPKISLSQTHQEGPFQVMFVGTQQQKKQKKLNTRKREGQDATNLTSAPAESCIQFP